MTKLEKINLFFGFVALLADLASLLAFSTGLLSFESLIPANMNLDSALFLYKILTFLFLVYGWFIFSWYLTRRSFNLKKGKKNSLSSRSSSAVSGIGFFLVPIAITWVIFASQTITSSAKNDTDIKAVATVTATKTALPIETPKSGTPNPTDISKTPDPTASNGDPTDISMVMGLMLGIPIGMPLLGLAIWGSINLLMPLINVELLDD